MADMSPPPLIWSIAGHDSSGGAGLSADQRAADAMGVHLCPIVACVTAQHSQGVQAIFPLPHKQLQAQLQALNDDMPPQAIKTGLLGDVELIRTVAEWVRRLREHHPELPLVIDPVLGASAGGAAFSDDAVLQAYRRELLPLATLITPNRAEALRLLGKPPRHDGAPRELPDLAALLRAMGAQAVVITGGDAPRADGGNDRAGDGTGNGAGDWAMDWLDAPHAQGWLCTRRVPTRHHHGSGCTFASAAASALAQGHVSADAVVLAKMLTTQALQHAHEAGHGPGPVMARTGQPLGPLPYLGLGRELPWQVTHGDASGAPLFKPFTPPADGLYGILPDSTQLDAAAQAGLRCLQLRHKAQEGVQAHIDASMASCAQHGATLFINDHWQQALERPTPPGLTLGLHLGQEDLLALSDTARAQLLASRSQLVLGLSSHSAWELARAAGCGASLIACGPVLPTTTKDMPWTPQGEHNLRWWTRHSPAPVVAIGGLLTPPDVERFAACRPAAVCVVRGLGQTASDMRQRVPVLREAVRNGVTNGMRRGLAHDAMPSVSPLAIDLPRPVL